MENSNKIQKRNQEFPISFGGIIYKNKKISHLIFRNNNDDVIEIPVDKKVADMIDLYLQKIMPSYVEHVEYDNDEPSSLS